MTRRSSAGAAALLQSSGKGRESRRDSNGAYDLGLLDQESVISFDDDDDDRSVWRWSRQGIGSIGVALLAMLIIFTMWPGIWNMHKIAKERGAQLHHRHPRGLNGTCPFSGAGGASGSRPPAGLTEAQVVQLIKQQFGSQMKDYDARREKNTKDLQAIYDDIQTKLTEVTEVQKAIPKEETLKADLLAGLKKEFTEDIEKIAKSMPEKGAAVSSGMAPEEAEKIISESKEQARIMEEMKNELEGLVKTLSDLVTDVKKMQQEGPIVKMTEEGEALAKQMEEFKDVAKSLKDASQQPDGQIAVLSKMIADAKELKTAMEEGLKALQKESVEVNQVLEMAKAEKKAIDENRQDFHNMLAIVNQSIAEVRKMSSKTDVQGLLDETTKIKEEIKKKEEDLNTRMVEVNGTLAQLRQIQSEALPAKVANETRKVAQELQDELDAIKDQAKVLEDLVVTVQQTRGRLEEAAQEALVLTSQENVTRAALGGSGSGLKPGERVVTKDALKDVIVEVIKEQGVGKGAEGKGADGTASGLNDAGYIAAIEETVEKVVRRYEADDTGLVDYAAAVSGGSIVASRSSPTYSPPGNLLPTEWYHRLGLSTNIGPRQVAISTGVKKPGDCWPFPGSQGKLTVKLREPIVPTNVSLEHIAKEITRVPSSAPKQFRVLGLPTTDEAGSEPIQLHTLSHFQYEIEKGRRVQTFPLNAAHGQSFSMITIEVLNNWGHSEYTCIYRVRVHGEEPSPAF